MLAEAIEPGGWVVLSAHDDFTDSIRARCRAEVITGGVGRGDVQASGLEIGWDSVKFELSFAGRSVPASIPVPAEHMVRNATLAVAAGLRMGLSLEEAAAGVGKIQLDLGTAPTQARRGDRGFGRQLQRQSGIGQSGLADLAGIAGARTADCGVGPDGGIGDHAR